MVIALIGILAGIAIPSYDNYREKVRVATAILGIGVMAKDIAGYFTVNGSYPASLADIGQGAMRDPWGNPYQYLRIATTGLSATPGGGSSSSVSSGTGSSTQAAATQGRARKDHFMVPINTDYDLYSMGPDGRSVAPLTASASRDDIIRASDGLFIGRASEF